MMSRSPALYQGAILEHGTRPHNLGVPRGANRSAEGHNLLCGDHLTLYLTLDNDIVRDAGFEGSACAVSRASASMLTDGVKGKRVREAEAMLARFQRMLASPVGARTASYGLGPLSVFAAVLKNPERVECASLAGNALVAALDGLTSPPRRAARRVESVRGRGARRGTGGGSSRPPGPSARRSPPGAASGPSPGPALR